jgi:VWFA-related protein
MKRSGLSGVCLTSLLVVGLTARQSQAPQFRAGVDLVQIDVVAVDKDGHPVPGLTAADFTLLDRKKPQKIVAFDEVNRARASAVATENAAPAALVKADVATNQIPPSDRLVVMVLDDLHVFRGRSDRVKDIAHQVLDALGPGSSMSILFTSGRHSLEFSRDRTELIGAIDTFVGQSVVRRPNPGTENPAPGNKVLNDSVSKATVQPAAPRSFGSGNVDAAAVLQKFFDDMTLHRTMEDAARMLIGAVGGRKAFVLVSEGTANNLDQMFKTQATPCDIRSAYRNPCYHQRSLLYAVEAMQRANVSLYAFDARGYVPNEDILLECAPTDGVRLDPCVGISPADPYNWIRNDQHGFEITAAATGGFAVTNSDDFSGGVARMVAEIDHYYLLGFTPSDPKGKGFRPVTVTVDRPGVTLHFRQGYSTGDESHTAAEKDKDPLIAMSAGLLPKTDVPLRLMAAPLSPAPAGSAGKAATRLVALVEASLPRAEILAASPRAAIELRYAVLAASLTDGKVVKDLMNTVSISSTGDGSSNAQADMMAVEIPVELALPPGRYQLRASVLSEALTRGGSVYLDVDVPDLTSTSIALGGPIVSSVEGVQVPLATGPSATLGLPFTPSLDRIFARTETLRVFCPVTRADVSRTLQATIEVVDAADRLAVSSRQQATPAGDAIDASLSLRELVTGAYRLRVTVTDGRATAQREVGIVIK